MIKLQLPLARAQADSPRAKPSRSRADSSSSTANSGTVVLDRRDQVRPGHFSAAGEEPAQLPRVVSPGDDTDRVTPHQPARKPADLSRFFIERANVGDVDGLVALYEPEAVLAMPDGSVAVGTSQIRVVYQQLLATRPTFTLGDQQSSLVIGDIALTSSKLLGGGATAEVARRQPDGTWRWIADQPNL